MVPQRGVTFHTPLRPRPARWGPSPSEIPSLRPGYPAPSAPRALLHLGFKDDGKGPLTVSIRRLASTTLRRISSLWPLFVLPREALRNFRLDAPVSQVTIVRETRFLHH